jgi:hydrogenase maturation factor HypF (carbamoyltransferase family)
LRKESKNRVAKTDGSPFSASPLSPFPAQELNTVGLTGGVFQNALLLQLLQEKLLANDFAVLTHRLVPSNDGGLALGQASIGRSKINI